MKTIVNGAWVALSISVALPAQWAVVPPVRPIGPILGKVMDSLKSVGGLRQLSDGRLLVNDYLGKQVLLFDSTLQHATHVIDASGTAVRNYPPVNPTIFRFLGDSTLFLDPTALSLLVIDPSGRIARIMSIPMANIAAVALGVQATRNVIDAKGRLVFSVALPPFPLAPGTPAKPYVPGAPPVLTRPDSAVILAANLATHRIDTIAFVRTAHVFPNTTSRDSLGFEWSDQVLNPMPVADAWAILSDGTLAVVRAQDFHIDWISSDGVTRASPRLPHEWVRLTDSAKTAIVDSLRAIYSGRPLGTQTVIIDGVPRKHLQMLGVADASEVPDYAPPFLGATTDADGNLWIREKQSAPPGAIWDLVNRSGVMFDRVQIPGGTSLQGFGPGVAYLSSREGAGLTLAKFRIR